MKYLILAIVIPIVYYLANKQNEKFNSQFDDLDSTQALNAKMKWAYEFWKVRNKHFLISGGMFLAGLTIFVLATKYHQHFDVMSMISVSLLLGSFIYFFSTVGLKSARYNLLLKEFDFEGMSRNAVVAQFKEWEKQKKQ